MRGDTEYMNAVGGEQIAPILLVRVIDMPTIADPAVTVSAYFTDCEEAISFFDEDGNAEAYLPCGMSFDAISAGKTAEVKSLRVRLDNVSRSFCTLVAQVDLSGVEVQFLRATRDSLAYPECAQVIIVGHINSWTVTETEIEAEVIVPLSLEQKVPRRLFWPRCGWEFGGTECGLTITAAVDRATSGNAISGGGELFHLATEAFDNNNSDYWGSQQTGTAISGAAYIGQEDLYFEVQTIRLLTYSSTDNNITSIKVQWKPDGGAWADIQTWTLPTTVSTWNTLTLDSYLTVPQGHSLRLLANSNLATDKIWRVFEIEFLSDFSAGCDHTVDMCEAYKNQTRYGGFPHLLKSRDPRVIWTKS